ncbi:Hypothetical protein CINCED_3A021731 [Cinara cedri]|nr:Hypothetical protein CINCED_3A021731 [Cinara cedri]
MKDFCATHVVRLYGVVSQNDPVFILTEYMEQGDLKSFLRLHCLEHDDGFCFAAPTLTDILRMAIEIADGMAYLTFKKYVHRDLSASNCLVSANNVVKVGGFGLARDVYQTEYYKENSTGMMPIRWMAPESLHTGLFTCFSDVWSFGVVLWEIATLGTHPYTDENDKDVISYVTGGGIMEKPDGCPDMLYDFMKLCWCFKASDRPTFNELVRRLLPCARADFEQLSFYHNGLLSETVNNREVDAPINGIPNKNILIKECNETEHRNVPKILTNQENVDHVLRGSSLPLEQIIP